MDARNPESIYYQAKQLFMEAVDLAMPDRVQLLETRCAESPDLRQAVEALLRRHDLNPPLKAAETEAAPSPRIWGKYEILGTLARGGTANVFRAVDPGRAGEVALKVFNPGFGSSEARARFEQEAEILGRLEHPGIVKLVDHGTLPTDQGPLPFVATEFVAGATLLDWAQQNQPDNQTRIRLLREIAATLGHAHQAGVTHRDLKPNNIIIRPDGTPCVLDFGIARLKEGGAASTDMFTMVGQLLGTVRYMSPEQARGDEVGPATDVHALGLLACELLTGQLPYPVPDETLTRAVAFIAGAEPALLSRLDPELAGPLEAVVHHCLARRPEKRYADAGQLADDLQRVLDGKPVRARAPGLGDRLGQKRRRRLALGLLLPVLVAVAFLGWQLLKPAGPEDPRSAGVYGLLDAADQRIHLEARSHEGLAEALNNLDTARRSLAAMPPSPEVTMLLRYLHWRLGEAHYFLGGMDNSPRSYAQALQSFALARQYRFHPAAEPQLLAGHAVSNRVMDVCLHHPHSGLALAQAALADFGNFTEEMSLAVTHSRVSLREISQPDTLAFRRGYSPTTTELFRVIAHSDLGRYLTELAAATDSLALLDEAIVLFNEVDDPESWRFNRGAHGMMQEYAGRAYMQRAALGEGTAARADRDSAAAHLGRALEIRSAGRFAMGHVLTLGSLVRLDLWDADRATDEARRSAALARGEERLAEALRLYATLEPVPRYAARLHLVGAEVQMRRGDADAVRQHLNKAAAGAGNLWPREKAMVHLLRCRLALLEDDLPGARGHWQAGRPLVGGGQHPVLARRYAELAEQLGNQSGD
jgi:predicted Ser/Thr protein kinase